MKSLRSIQLLLLTLSIALPGSGSLMAHDDEGIHFLQYDSLSGEELWLQMQDDHKGKVIYGDLCASYCRPCIYYFSMTDSLHGVYADKEVAFVYLWHRSKRESIDQLVEEYHLIGDHYLLRDEQGEDIQEMLNRQGYPTYFLIDKKRESVYKNAPRPGTMMIYKHINERLSR